MSYKNHEVYKAHESLGFPEIPKLEQIEMIVEKDYSRISELIPELKDKGFPFGMLNEYITITKGETTKTFPVESSKVKKTGLKQDSKKRSA